MLTSLRHHATTVAICATFTILAIAGSATAARLVTGADIKNNSISSVDIKDRTLQVGDFSLDAGRALQGPRGPAGPRGPEGEPGPAGTGGAGQAGLERVTGSFPSQPIGATPQNLASGQVSCPAGKYLIGSGYAFNDLELVAQTISLVDDTKVAVGGAPAGAHVSATSGRTFSIAIEVYCANVA